MSIGVTFPCGIHTYNTPSEVIIFFEIENREERQVIGMVMFSRDREDYLKSEPLESCRLDNWKQEFQADQETHYEYKAKIAPHKIDIFDEYGDLWLTLI